MLVGVGVLGTLAGVIFTLQGVGVLGGSVMSGVTFWAVAGPVIALAGLAIAAIGLRGGLASQARRLGAGKMLRSHSSAMVPPGLRELARDPGDDAPTPSATGFTWRFTRGRRTSWRIRARRRVPRERTRERCLAPGRVAS